ncbi:protoporphyrinogen oxidase [Salinibacterium sp. M195]|uniref:protoporphyrinogen oxidase n=1 Tax=Salinibacterium sp. M195 TaxID=2583374 RepID=UPI001C635620|nr:protoporphyrinogen oxidase [Salinibacterium sp. M195]QYH36491.1 protoporphyrinogen oxidase [Salinibacterium sp. M195]
MNARLLILGFGIAVGYVVGARAGRERYDQMKGKATEVWESPRVSKARTSVEDYARTQAPILRDRAEAVVKATPGFVTETAKDVAENARDLAGSARETAKELAESASGTAKRIAGNARESAKELTDRASETARGAVGRVTETADDVRDNATKTASELRERGETAIDRAFLSAGKARDEALATLDDDDDDDDDATENGVDTAQK